MSKKAILTDFSALKGKITLSEGKDIHSGVEKKNSYPTTKGRRITPEGWPTSCAYALQP